MNTGYTDSSHQGASGGASRQSEESTGQGAGTSGAQRKPESELVDELERLGQKFREGVETAWNSEQRRQAEEKLHNGLRAMAQSLEQGGKDVGSSKGAQDLRGAAEDVAERVRGSKVAHELADVLAQGLRALSEQLDRLEKEMAQDESKDSTAQRDSAAQPKTDAQDIPIDRT